MGATQVKNKSPRSRDEILDQSHVKDMLFRAERDMFPKMKASSMSLIIGTSECDAKLALEVGAAVLLDKPLLVVIPPGRTISATLRRVATHVVEIDVFSDPDAQVKLNVAVALVLNKQV